MCDLTIKDLVDEIVDHFNDGLSEADERCRDKAEDEAHYNELFGKFDHRWHQSDWQPVRDAISKWVDARPF